MEKEEEGNRCRMENLIYQSFRHNMRLNDFGLLNKFVHLISVDRLQLLIADEFIEHDVLRSFESLTIFRRVTFWQIYTMISAFFMVSTEIQFGMPA